MSKLNQLKAMTTVVADTGDIDAIERFKPVDATTNPTLLLKAAQNPASRPLLQEAINWGRDKGATGNDFLVDCTERFTINIGKKIAGIVPGRVSTEVDARLSFDTQAMIDKAHHLIELYAAAGVPSERILIKLASTWEGIRAAEVLEKSNIQCNLTLLFSFSQAVACADAGVTLISPFVGRIYDWYQQRSPGKAILPEADPGVQSVRKIYQYYKAHQYSTIVMGASFRSTGQIEALAGCDNLTVSPELLDQLASDEGHLERKLSAGSTAEPAPAAISEAEFRWQLNEDAMATEKLAEGIRNFALNQNQLEQLIKETAV